MKKTGFLSPFQKKTVRVMLLVYFFSMFNLPILVHAQTEPNLTIVQEEIIPSDDTPESTDTESDAEPEEPV